jgi:hypothetical protein
MISIKDAGLGQVNDAQRARRKDFRDFGAAAYKGGDNVPTSRQGLIMSKHSPKTQRRNKALPVLGIAGVSLALAGAASASTSTAAQWF